VLTPGRFVGAEEVEDDGEPFEEKMPRLVAELYAQFARADSRRVENDTKKRTSDCPDLHGWETTADPLCLYPWASVSSVVKNFLSSVLNPSMR